MSCSGRRPSSQRLHLSGLVGFLNFLINMMMNDRHCYYPIFFMCLPFSATEAHDHDGLPHTLEHLIFMGSEKYPYKVRQVVINFFVGPKFFDGHPKNNFNSHLLYIQVTHLSGFRGK